MPELLEAEFYRRSLAAVRGGRVVWVDGNDPLVVPDAVAVQTVLVGGVIADVRRHGKVVMVDTEQSTVVLRFGMTGRLIVGDDDPIPALAYGPSDGGKRYDRWAIGVQTGREVVTVRLSDPRRLARVLVDPEMSGLGPDAATVTPEHLAERLANRGGPVKTVLMDQQVIAGLGNLLADEVLWRAGVAPNRPANSLTVGELTRLAEVVSPMLDELMERGGSHRGDLSVELRQVGARCPMDGAELVRRSIGGRTSWSCPQHQR